MSIHSIEAKKDAVQQFVEAKKDAVQQLVSHAFSNEIWAYSKRTKSSEIWFKNTSLQNVSDAPTHRARLMHP